MRHLLIKTSMLLPALLAVQPAWATQEANVPAAADPDGLIIVKVLPPEAGPRIRPSTDAKNQRITNRKDPRYIRCRVEPVAGSILKTRQVCMSNRDWTLAIRLGNRYARDFVADNQPGFQLP